jgi:hypothetical protein
VRHACALKDSTVHAHGRARGRTLVFFIHKKHTKGHYPWRTNFVERHVSFSATLLGATDLHIRRDMHTK